MAWAAARASRTRATRSVVNAAGRRVGLSRRGRRAARAAAPAAGAAAAGVVGDAVADLAGDAVAELAGKATTDYVPEPLRQGASVLFTVLLGYYLFFRLARRAEIAASQPVRELERERRERQALILKPKGAEGAEGAEQAEARDVPVEQLWKGAATGAFFTAASYLLAQGAERIVDGTGFTTDDETVYQLAITFRTIVLGLFLLLTGVYGVNTVGLTILAARKSLGIEDEPEAGDSQVDKQEEEAEQPVDR